MMTNLVLDLQNKCNDPSVDVTTLLRIALTVAKKLDIIDIQKWIESELNGYQKHDKIPLYRILEGSLKVLNPIHGWQPLNFENPKDKDNLEKGKITNTICELEDLLKKGSGNFQIDFSNEDAQKLMKMMGFPLHPSLHITSPQISRIINIVRNMILEWTLELEKKGILGEGQIFSENEKKNVAHLPITNVYNIGGNVQNLTSIHDMNESQFQQAGDNSLQSQTKQINSEELEKIIMLINKIQQNTLSEEQQNEIQSYLATLNDLKKQEKPSVKMVQFVLQQICVTLINIGSNAAVAAVIKQINLLL